MFIIELRNLQDMLQQLEPMKMQQDKEKHMQQGKLVLEDKQEGIVEQGDIVDIVEVGIVGQEDIVVRGIVVGDIVVVVGIVVVGDIVVEGGKRVAVVGIVQQGRDPLLVGNYGIIKVGIINNNYQLI